MQNLLFDLAVMIASGMLFGRLAKLAKLPNVTGYLVAGLLIGPSVFGFLSEDFVDSISVISEVSLGFIAFSIGNEFKLSYFRRVGAAPIVIACMESLGAVLAVFLALLAFGQPLPFSLALASIAAATAPAATIMVIKQYRAKGPVTETLLSVVAIDDATALILFSLCATLARVLGGGTALTVRDILLPLWEIFGALLIGALLGVLFLIPLRFFKKSGNRLALIFAFVFAGLGIAEITGVSNLLLCMAMGAVVANLSSDVGHLMELCDGVTPPIFILFFVASGADLKLKLLPTVGIVGAVYVLFRVIGKVGCASLGAVMSHTDAKVKKYLGFALVPQAGVAIGLSKAAAVAVPEYAAEISTVILCATLIYELVGPAITKLSLRAAGEIGAQALQKN
ncbi:MAG: cation:proton antiporter [Clostridia bacterium]|nr:cation:proton antiporter [Clostridia bacterium]